MSSDITGSLQLLKRTSGHFTSCPGRRVQQMDPCAHPSQHMRDVHFRCSRTRTSGPITKIRTRSLLTSCSGQVDIFFHFFGKISISLNYEISPLSFYENV